MERLGDVFRQAMDDDFDTSSAIAAFQHLRGELNSLLGIGLSGQAREEARKAFRHFGQVLGLFQLSVQDWEFGDLCPPPNTWSMPIQMLPLPRKKKWDPRYGVTITQPVMPPTIPSNIRTLTDEQVERKLADRDEARRKKDFAKADEIRAELDLFGITIEDRTDGTSRWKR